MNDVAAILPRLLVGAIVTAQVTLLAAPLAALLAFVAGLARLSGWGVVRQAALVYGEIFRGTSLLVQLFFLFYVLPVAGVSLPPIETGVLALGLNFGAYGAEVVRGAVVSVDRGQWDASVAINMTRGTAMRRIILPQAILRMLPPFGNLLIELLKATSLLSLITVADLTFRGKELFQLTGNTTTIYSLTFLIYLALALPLAAFVRWAERRLSFVTPVRPTK
jgi:polar amino acid transport system permease protein